MKKILLTGATGFIGSNILRALSKENKVTAIYRNERKIPVDLQNHKNIQWVKAEFTEFITWNKEIAGKDAVYNCVGIIRETENSKFQTVHADIPGHLITEAVKCKVKRFIQISALGAGTDKSIEYFYTKQLAEEYLTASGITYTIFRPSFVFSYFSEAMILFRKLALAPLSPMIGGGKYRFEPVFVRDLAEAAAAALHLKNAQNKILEIGGPQILSFKEILSTLAKVEGKKFFPFYVPVWMVKPVAALEKYFPFIPLTTDQLKMLVRGSVCENNSLQKVFKLEGTGFEEGLLLSKNESI